MSELAMIRKLLDGMRRSLLEAVEGIPEGEAFQVAPAVHPGDEAAYRTGMSEQELNWSPAPGVNSTAVVLVHLAAAERYWIGEVIGGKPFNRDRAAEFRPEVRSKDAVLAAYRDTVADSDRVLDKLTDADMERRFHGATGEDPAREILIRMIAHAAHHRGQILVLKRVMHSAG